MIARRTILKTAFGKAIRRPNVVFLLTDQWRAQAFGYRRDANAHTPFLDLLARESCDFTNAVSGFPVCSPYRASLMTGQYATRHGLLVNDVELKPNGPTLGESFRKAGYATGYIGKWHIYGSPDGKFGRRLAYVPEASRFGFEDWKGCECTHDYNRSLYYQGSNPTPKYWDGYDAKAQTRAACEWIEAQSKRSDPYFLALSLGPPHDPYGTAPEPYRAAYQGREIQLRPNVPPEKAEEARKNLRGYYAHVAALDACVGQVLTAVERTGQANDTVFVFASDHGDMLQSQGTKLKQQPWDESIRVPFLVRYPRGLGRKRRSLVTPIDAPDVMPTLLGLAGLRVPDSVQGKNFAPLLRGQANEEAEPAALLNLPASFSVVRQYGIAEYRGLRTPRHTYVRSIHGPWLLYDNEQDPYQKSNLVNRERARDLQARLDRRLEKMLRAAGDDFLPGDRYIERAGAQHYQETNVPVGQLKSPWGDWESTWR